MKMQKIILLLVFTAAMLMNSQVSAQTTEVDSTGYPGDGLSLEAVLDLFKKSESLEDFEKKLNQESNNVNNLDVNEDGEIDYIRVVDNMEKESHAIVLQVPINAKENQDVAVITLEKTGNEAATLQIIGDKDVYGDEKIVEPFEEEKQKSGKNGPAPDLQPAVVIVNVWFWPPVRYVYHPTYVVYRSPWGWSAYPTYWHPWRPHPYVVYYPRVAPYHRHYHHVTVVTCHHAHGVYAPRRTYSTTVHTRTTSYKTTRTMTQGRQPATTNQPGRQQATTAQPSKDATPAGRQPATTAQPSREAAPSGKATSDMQMSKQAEPTAKDLSKNPSKTKTNQATNKPADATQNQPKKQGAKSNGAKKGQGTHTGPRNGKGRH